MSGYGHQYAGPVKTFQRNYYSLTEGTCYTWGSDHFQTFDNKIFAISTTCNYIFASDCSGDFNIQLRRKSGGTISRIIIQIVSTVIKVENGSITVNDEGPIILPYNGNQIQIHPSGEEIKLTVKHQGFDIVIAWDNADFLMVALGDQHQNKTCGLCGDFNGIPDYNEFSVAGNIMDLRQFARNWQIDDPTEDCKVEHQSYLAASYLVYEALCTGFLNMVAPLCQISRADYIKQCQWDLFQCAMQGDRSCACGTLSQYSRQCSRAQHPVNNWRNSTFCPMADCPENQIYQECGSPCLSTCLNPQFTCASYCKPGCFCPPGTVLDYITSKDKCIPRHQCPCVQNGKIYAPGDKKDSLCTTCTCVGAQWDCSDIQCPGTCSIEGGSFITTFDGRTYRFHGDCEYLLVGSDKIPRHGTIEAVFERCGTAYTKTRLASLIYAAYEMKIIFSMGGKIEVNNQLKKLPFRAANIRIYRRSSSYIQMDTDYGLEMLLKVTEVFQVFITVDVMFSGRTNGLCGNFNGDTTDDFKSSMKITENNPSNFVNSWRVTANCGLAHDEDMDPCSLSQVNEMFAEAHCAVLLKESSIFGQCHEVLDPIEFYENCRFVTCNYDESNDFMCASLASYVSACAKRGVFLLEWRNTIDTCRMSCPHNQTFSYDSRACNRTCMSLFDPNFECSSADLPVDGCNCPEQTYLDDAGKCVSVAECPCYLANAVIARANEKIILYGGICVCENGSLKCSGQDPQEYCYPPKVYFKCENAQEGEYGAACAPTCQMLAAEGQCLTTNCVSGCICPDGLVLDEAKGCVHPDDCSCEYSGFSYERGMVIVKDCMKCFCDRGKWNCNGNEMCPLTCMVHGEGHISTFGGKQYVFDGNCEYILVQDACSTIYAQPSFKIVAENVICSSSKTVCTKTIKIYYQDILIKMTDGTYKVIPENATDQFTVVHNQMYLMFSFGNLESLQLIVTWNLKMNTYIQIAGPPKLSVCGLCGNANSNIKDELITQSHYSAFTLMNFINSWKENPMCDDVTDVVYPCAKNPYRKSWAEKRCKLIQSDVFQPCHNLLPWRHYYDNCIRDACGCELVGDCDCLCDAVAAFAKACLDAGVCIDWRTPDYCPVNCDFYNTHDRRTNSYKYAGDIECKWHYQPCLCPNAQWTFPKTNIEGCYNCSIDEYYDAGQQRCAPCTPLPTPIPTSHATSALSTQTSTIASSTVASITTLTTSTTESTMTTTSTTELTMTTTSTTDEGPVGGTLPTSTSTSTATTSM
ncbi:mucin-6-like [Scyliorhinus canicula]|uniref:mucin-6-like n=1 Tax=Scyliorhinus canicula TaxID=7830 RepID=UPI0018F2B237|nr:mucin-6-like [Scyliorhinus canicula]